MDSHYKGPEPIRLNSTENNIISNNYLILENFNNLNIEEKNNQSNIKSDTIHFYMFYYSEPVETDFGKYSNVIDFIKLEPQTKYFEGAGFSKITNIPNKKYIGILTPSITKKTGLSIDFIVDRINYHDADIIPLFYYGTNVVDQAVIYHNEKFRIVWNWLLNQINFPTDVEIPSFFCNLWILKKKYFLEFLFFINKIILILEGSPPEIQMILNSDSMYEGRISREDLLLKTGYSYYTYHPFMTERVICLFAKIKDLSVSDL